jgi:hypothetical protein
MNRAGNFIEGTGNLALTHKSSLGEHRFGKTPPTHGKYEPHRKERGVGTFNLPGGRNADRDGEPRGGCGLLACSRNDNITRAVRLETGRKCRIRGRRRCRRRERPYRARDPARAAQGAPGRLDDGAQQARRRANYRHQLSGAEERRRLRPERRESQERDRRNLFHDGSRQAISRDRGCELRFATGVARDDDDVSGNSFPDQTPAGTWNFLKRDGAPQPGVSPSRPGPETKFQRAKPANSALFARLQEGPETAGLGGGGGSQIRTRLHSKIPCKTGKSREFAGKPADFMKTGLQFCNNFNALRDEFPSTSI